MKVVEEIREMMHVFNCADALPTNTLVHLMAT